MSQEAPPYQKEQGQQPAVNSDVANGGLVEATEKLDLNTDAHLPGYDNKSEPEFIKILAAATDSDYAVTSYLKGEGFLSSGDSDKLDRIPNLPDTIAHLKFLRALGVLKKKIVGNDNPDHLYTIKNWQVFVTQAVKRFIVFVTACKKALAVPRVDPNDEVKLYLEGSKRVEKYLEFFNSLLPPLDVLMVWHAFLLNPKSFYDSFMRNGFLQFADFPFPFKRISESINNFSFEYEPDEKLKLKYLDVIREVSHNETDLIYAYDSFSMFEPLVSVHCPTCGFILLKDIPYTNDSKTGFADESFKGDAGSSLCECDFSKNLNHEELRKRQLVADYFSELAFPGSFKYFTGVLADRHLRKRDPIAISSYVKKIFAITALVSVKFVSMTETIKRSMPSGIRRGFIKIILRQYLGMNLIQTLVPNSFQVSEDLVGCVLRQERFVEKMNEIDWLHSPVIKESLYESSIRYSRFFKLLTYYDNKKMLVPTLDIDLIWHTHQLAMTYYIRDCMKSRRGGVIDHDDKVEESRLDDGFERTAKEYRRQFKEEYSICFCWYCVCARSNSKSTMKKLFKKKVSTEDEKKMFSKNPLYHRSLGLTHISLHNAIALPTRLAEKKRSDLEAKYSNKNVPWREDSGAYMYNYYPFLFVVPPLAPIGVTDCGFYTSGMCCTVRDGGSTAGSNCSGMGSCSPGMCGGSNSSNGCGGGGACASGGSGGCGGGGGGGGGGCGGGGGGGCGGGGCGGGN